MRQKRLFELLKQHSYKVGNYTLSSGKVSPYFLDCKQTLLLAEGHYLVAELILDEMALKFKDADISGVAAVELGACSIASAVSTLSNVECNNDWVGALDALYIRKSTKEYGSGRLIEGTLPPNSNVILLEDVITTGGSSMRALHVLKGNHYNPVAVISIIDRLQGGAENIKKYFDIPSISLFTVKDFE
jgi:orotate phosphoribosyltransferase